MVGSFKRAVQEVPARKMDRDTCLGQLLRTYRRRSGTDGKSFFEILFGIKPWFLFEAAFY